MTNLTTKSVCPTVALLLSSIQSDWLPSHPGVPGGIFSQQKARVTGPATITGTDRQISAPVPAGPTPLGMQRTAGFPEPG